MVDTICMVRPLMLESSHHMWISARPQRRQLRHSRSGAHVMTRELELYTSMMIFFFWWAGSFTNVSMWMKSWVNVHIEVLMFPIPPSSLRTNNWANISLWVPLSRWWDLLMMIIIFGTFLKCISFVPRSMLALWRFSLLSCLKWSYMMGTFLTLNTW